MTTAAYDKCLTDFGRGGGAQAGRGRHRRHQRRRVRQIDQLVAIRARTAERFRAAADQGRRQSIHARRRPRAVRRILCRARCPRRRRDHRRGGLRRADRLYRPGGAAARHRQFQSRAEGRQGGRGIPAGRGAGQRHPGPQERILQERRGPDPRHRRGDAHRIPHDHRCRLRAAARRRARRRHLRPHGAAGEL